MEGETEGLVHPLSPHEQLFLHHFGPYGLSFVDDATRWGKPLHRSNPADEVSARCWVYQHMLPCADAMCLVSVTIQQQQQQRGLTINTRLPPSFPTLI